MAVSQTSKSAKTWDPEALLSPRDLADAIGASESSLRRWIDNGDVKVSRTAGGHRRVRMGDAVRFIRKIGTPVLHPEILQLPVESRIASAFEPPLAARQEEDLYAALLEGKEEHAIGLVIAWYLSGSALPELFDGPLRGAMTRIGLLWKHDARGILVEHRATQICLSVINNLSSLLPGAEPSAPVAIGCAPEGDPYQIPSAMVAAVLSDAGLREVNFGANTPIKLLSTEAELLGASVVWLSVSAMTDPKPLIGQVKTLAAALARQGSQLLIGGHGVADLASVRAPNVIAINSMHELAEFAKGLRRLGRSSNPS